MVNLRQMSKNQHNVWRAIVEEVRYYPSPHNSQPIKIKFISDAEATIYYDLDLGLPAENYGIPFGHVCVGVFLESLHVVANAKGYVVEETLLVGDMDFSAKNRLHPLGRVRLVPSAVEGAAERFRAFKVRQTSRRPYDASIMDEMIIMEAERIAKAMKHTFHTTHNPTLVKKIIHINQATLFDDLKNDAVYAEIMHWLRFSKKEAADKRDGLSAETMLMPGPALKFGMRHRGLWRMPVIGSIIRWMYLRTMRGVAQLGWLEGPFKTPHDFVEAGRCFMRIWLYFTVKNVYLHPFGTVITNPRSHKQFVQAAGIKESDSSMAWMLFRFGHSKRPPKAWRRSGESMIIGDNDA